jgi:hypothetical protein
MILMQGKVRASKLPWINSSLGPPLVLREEGKSESFGNRHLMDGRGIYPVYAPTVRSTI